MRCLRVRSRKRKVQSWWKPLQTKKSSRYPSGYGIQMPLKNEESAESIYSDTDRKLQIETALWLYLCNYIFIYVLLLFLALLCRESGPAESCNSDPFCHLAELASLPKNYHNFYNSTKWDNWNFYKLMCRVTKIFPLTLENWRRKRKERLELSLF